METRRVVNVERGRLENIRKGPQIPESAQIWEESSLQKDIVWKLLKREIESFEIGRAHV